MEKLLQKTNVVLLIDVGTLDRNQFEYILQNARCINENENNIIVNVNNNDSDTFGIVKWKLKQHIIVSSDIITYNLDNKFRKEDELQEINKLLPIINLPQYNEKRNMLDQLIYGEQIIQKKGSIQIKKSK